MSERDYLQLELHMPPSVNDYWKPTTIGPKKARIFRTTAGDKYREHVRDQVIRQAGFGVRVPGVVRVVAALFFETAAGDVDNRSKGLLDGLEAAGVYKNDRLVYEHNIFRQGRAPKPGICLVQIERIGDWECLTPAQYKEIVGWDQTP